jgi:heat shock protein HslJ
VDARILATLTLTCVAAACSQSESPKSGPAPLPSAEPPAEQVSFVNKVWSVAESGQVEVGALRVFLSDGTLVMASPGSEPAFGRWSQDGDRLTITEEGQAYDTDVLQLSEETFRIRMHSPGEPVVMLLRPAEQKSAAQTQDVVQVAGTVHHLDVEGGVWVIRTTDGTQYKPVELPEAYQVDGLAVEAEARRRDNVVSVDMAGQAIELLTIRKRSGAAPKQAALWGTAWRLEDLAGAGVVDRAQATLEFPAEGRVAGKGSCNRFGGTAKVGSGGAIGFGAVVATRMACVEAVMNQESAYFAALEKAERYETDGDNLYLYVADNPAPLRFVRAEEPRE